MKELTNEEVEYMAQTDEVVGQIKTPSIKKTINQHLNNHLPSREIPSCLRLHSSNSHLLS